jgi:hypothetical protein
MYFNSIRAIPFSRVSSLFISEMYKIPYPILIDINEKYIIPTTISGNKNQLVIKNDIPIIKTFTSLKQLYGHCRHIDDYKKYIPQIESNSISANTFFRDITTCSIHEKQIALMRVWFDYNCQTRFIRFMNVIELCNDSSWCMDTLQYMNIISSPKTIITPSFNDFDNDNDNNEFIKKLQFII